MTADDRKKKIALVGRPNVGKSTLFNRLSIKEKAVVHDMPGVTRDRKYADAKIGPMEILLIDTPGLEEAKEGALEHRMMQQTMMAIAEADLTCLLIDNIQGVTPEDKFFANIIRKYSKNYVLVVNKCERSLALDGAIYKLGFGEVAAISAAHGIGLADLYDVVDKAFKRNTAKFEDGILQEDSDANTTCKKSFDAVDGIHRKDGDISLVIVGRPNAGKSTFVNALLNEERMLTGAEAGITRESIEVLFKHKDKNFKLIDTAGLRKRSNVTQSLEKLSTGSTIGSINFANIVVLMLDATIALEVQDLNIAGYVIDQGRGLVIAVNKWDLISHRREYIQEFTYKLERHLPQVKGIEVVFISSLKNENVSDVLDACSKAFKLWNTRISTRQLNDQLRFIIDRHPLPIDKKLGRRVRIKYMSQVSSRPPTFKLFCNLPDAITKSYQRYLANSIREAFGLWGIPLRLRFAKTQNPYAR